MNITKLKDEFLLSSKITGIKANNYLSTLLHDATNESLPVIQKAMVKISLAKFKVDIAKQFYMVMTKKIITIEQIRTIL